MATTTRPDEILITEVVVRVGFVKVRVYRTMHKADCDQWEIDGGHGAKAVVEGYDAALAVALDVARPLNEGAQLRHMAEAAEGRARAAAWKVRDG